jgi:uncharacterized membrane protein
MNDLSHKMQSPQGEDIGQEVQQPAEAATNQQGGSAGTYQQGLPPVQGNPQYTPPGGYQQYGYQPNPPEQQYAGYQQQQQQYAPQYTGGVGPFETTSLGMRARTAGLLCYLFGWVSGLIFFLLEKENRFVRFHAMQSILFFGILTILGWVFSHLPFLGFMGAVIGLVMFIGWIVMMIKAHRGEYYKIPLFGDLAESLMGQIKV